LKRIVRVASVASAFVDRRTANRREKEVSAFIKKIRLSYHRALDVATTVTERDASGNSRR